MSALLNRFALVLSALRQLGPEALALYAWYKIGLRTWLPRQQAKPGPDVLFRSFLTLPDRDTLAGALGEAGVESLREEVEEILAGQVRLFGSKPVPLVLAPAGPLAHWTAYERGLKSWGAEDVKFIWEPGRFGWVYPLARFYHLSGDERCPQAFWSFTEAFLEANPPMQGPHWASAQEVSLRLIAFVFGLTVFGSSAHTTPERMRLLASAIASHAHRIPPTLAYARSQNNNHLLSEAAGLYTAAAALPAHPRAGAWKREGWRWFNRGIQKQVAPSGAYAQHSTNYHRLMLQISHWMDTAAGSQGDVFPAATRARLSASAHWLLDMLDPVSGQVPNLGPNDGAYILPLAAGGFSDFRPILQAASRAFLGKPCLPPGPWDELIGWLPARQGVPVPERHPAEGPPAVLRGPKSWAYLRTATFTSRPGQADQLHLDLWWQGINVAQDAGTYLYNGAPPWENALAHTAVHNTLTYAGQDQMRRVKRFLWLDWAQAEVLGREQDLAEGWEWVTASHNGYRRFGVTHVRRVRRQGDLWTVRDDLVSSGKPGGMGIHTARLHWLLPDWPWELEASTHMARLRLSSPLGWVWWEIKGESNVEEFSPQITRAGECVAGKDNSAPTWGWSSPTYGEKIPALAFAVEVRGPLPLVFTSTFTPE